MAKHLFPSEPWASAYRDALNSNPKYAKAGRDWTHGAVAMVVRADADLGLNEDMAVLLDVHAGTCRSATYMPAPAARDAAGFVIEGLYGQWAALIRDDLNPIKVLMQGKLKMTKGRLPTLLRYVESSNQLLASARLVDTEYRQA